MKFIAKVRAELDKKDWFQSVKWNCEAEWPGLSGDALLKNFSDHKANALALIEEKLEERGSKIKLYRALKVEPESFLKALEQGLPVKGYEGLGVHWTYDEETASPNYEPAKYHGDSIVMVTAWVDQSHVAWEPTLTKIVDPTFSFEREIQLQVGSPLEIESVHVDGEAINLKAQVRASHYPGLHSHLNSLGDA